MHGGSSGLSLRGFGVDTKGEIYDPVAGSF